MSSIHIWSGTKAGARVDTGIEPLLVHDMSCRPFACSFGIQSNSHVIPDVPAMYRSMNSFRSLLMSWP